MFRNESELKKHHTSKHKRLKRCDNERPPSGATSPVAIRSKNEIILFSVITLTASLLE
ncbi:unnamed protein product [Brugia timori]|uniref:C2H2-type domain-containing protein n=1 Tax=Brugia timori TaxID=42155 RepID=A0A0R3QHX7_9BILA|nr:unnamed protein product [Brugia timori]